MSLLWISSLALAASPHLGISVGGAFTSGYDRSYAYTSFAPYLDLTSTWHFGPFEAWGGASTSALVASEQSRVYASAPLQGEIGLGLGSARTGVGLYWGYGFGGAELGGYARVLFPESRDRAWGMEGRLFALTRHADVGGALLVRADFGRFRYKGPRREEKPPPPPPPVYHEDPYGG